MVVWHLALLLHMEPVTACSAQRRSGICHQGTPHYVIISLYFMFFFLSVVFAVYVIWSCIRITLYLDILLYYLSGIFVMGWFYMSVTCSKCLYSFCIWPLSSALMLLVGWWERHLVKSCSISYESFSLGVFFGTWPDPEMFCQPDLEVFWERWPVKQYQSNRSSLGTWWRTSVVKWSLLLQLLINSCTAVQFVC